MRSNGLDLTGADGEVQLFPDPATPVIAVKAAVVTNVHQVGVERIDRGRMLIRMGDLSGPANLSDNGFQVRPA